MAFDRLFNSNKKKSALNIISNNRRLYSLSIEKTSVFHKNFKTIHNLCNYNSIRK